MTSPATARAARDPWGIEAARQARDGAALLHAYATAWTQDADPPITLDDLRRISNHGNAHETHARVRDLADSHEATRRSFSALVPRLDEIGDTTAFRLLTQIAGPNGIEEAWTRIRRRLTAQQRFVGTRHSIRELAMVRGYSDPDQWRGVSIFTGMRADLYEDLAHGRIPDLGLKDSDVRSNLPRRRRASSVVGAVPGREGPYGRGAFSSLSDGAFLAVEVE